jgi:hypothetical protein
MTFMRKLDKALGAAAFLLVVGMVSPAAAQTQVWGVWHCSTDYCSWASAPDMTTGGSFDTQNHWLLNRNPNGQPPVPSVNLVTLSFVNPLKLLDQTTDSGDTNGVPNGMTSAVVNYFESQGIRVSLAIGGITYTADWDTALSTNPTQLGLNAAALATNLNVGIEIDYENSTAPNTAGLEAFVTAFRSVHPYDATGSNMAARLTIDLGAGAQYLSALAQYATANWLQDSAPVLDYANAMVVRSKTSVSAYEKQWLEHIDGYPTLQVGPLAPARLTGSFFLSGPDCVGPYASSDQAAAKSFVTTVAPGGQGTTSGMLGLMWWAAGCSAAHGACTFPPNNTCQAGIGGGAAAYQIPIPMPALRQQ